MKKNLFKYKNKKINKDLERYQAKVEIFNKLRKYLNKSIVTCHFDSSSILLSFKNNYNVLILCSDPKDFENRNSIHFESIQIYCDKDFEALNSVVSNIKYEKNKYLTNLIRSFSNKKYSNKKRNEQYHKITSFQLKKLFREEYRSDYDPKNEIFLFGNDEFQFRYNNRLRPRISLSNSKIQIIDESAFLFKKDGKLWIDLFSGTHYKDDRFIYLGDIFYYKKCSKNSKDYDMTTFYKKGNKNRIAHFKKVLKKGIDLKNIDKIPYFKANGKIMTLKKDKNTFYFIYKNKKVEIYHPDLLIYKIN